MAKRLTKNLCPVGTRVLVRNIEDSAPYEVEIVEWSREGRVNVRYESSGSTGWREPSTDCLLLVEVLPSAPKSVDGNLEQRVEALRERCSRAHDRIEELADICESLDCENKELRKLIAGLNAGDNN